MLLREGSRALPGCKPLDSVALEMIRCFMLALDCRGSGWITLDFNVGYGALHLQYMGLMRVVLGLDRS